MTLCIDDTRQFQADLIRELRALDHATDTITVKREEKECRPTKKPPKDFASWFANACGK